jgi:hypothetical protein
MLQDRRQKDRTYSLIPRGRQGGGISAGIISIGTMVGSAADTDPDLVDSIVEYVQRRGTATMEEVVQEAPLQFRTVGLSQDKIGW